MLITDRIVVLNFGGQYAHLIGRRVRENKVYSDVLPCDVDPDLLTNPERKGELKGIILSGGPTSVYGEESLGCNPQILEMEIPILGICYGHQLIAHLVGGKVEPADKMEYGLTHVDIEGQEELLKGLGREEEAWASHGDIVQELPSDFQIMARTKNCPIAAFAHRERDIYGLQWHPEVTHTENGDRVLRNFIFKICECESSWNMEEFVDNSIEEIKNEVGEGNCIIGISGGVDSSTAGALASMAVGENVTGVFVDHGLMREGEPEKIEKAFQDLEMDFKLLDERERFLDKLKGVTDPEEKRSIIGTEFIRVFEKVAEDVDADYLIQGTIYPDWIESGSTDHSDLIKSHHNVGGLPSELGFRGIIEPLRDLYKDEVRRVAEKLGVSEEIVNRQPFPGPGLAVRMVGEVTPEKLRILKKADLIFREEVESAGLDENLWQYFAVLPGTRSTGVKGDSRDYGYTVALRAVESKEAMTASFAKIPYDFLENVSSKITNQIPEITRVVYDITHKPPATIEWE